MNQGLNIRPAVRHIVAAVLAVGAASAAWADPAVVPAPVSAASPGALVGIVVDAANAAVARATVTAVRDDGSIRATVSDSSGAYSFGDLPPGKWSVSVHADGLGDAGVTKLVVAASAATRRDITVGSAPQQPVLTHQGQSAAALANAGAAAGSTAGGDAGFWSNMRKAVAFATLPDSGVKQHPSLVASLDGGAAPAAAPAPVPSVPEALQTPDPAPTNDAYTPLANVGDIGWMNGNTRESNPIFDTKFFTPEIRFDTNYLQDFNHPVDHTIAGSTEEFRSGEFQIEQVSFGGNFHWNGVQARFLAMLGDFATTTPRNDASQAVGQWDLQGAYKYMSEANAGYHWDNIGHGFNIDAGIFVSYIGLFSYYNFDNWTYQPSFVSSNTPWFFNGLRIQYWPTQNLKIEPWLINGWQSYAKFNSHPGFGGQVLYIPSNDFKLVFNTYTLGQDNIGGVSAACNQGNPYAAGLQDGVSCPASPAPSQMVNWEKVQRIHEDDSVLWKYFDSGDATNSSLGPISRMALSLTFDIGCEYGGSIGGRGGVSCTGGPNKESFIGSMLYNRVWFDHNLFAVTLGGGFMNNPGRYLALTPPINGATSASGTPYFEQQPGLKLYQWDTQLNLQYMPKDWITWWTEVTFRHSNVPYWNGPGGMTPPGGYSTSPAGGVLGGEVCNNGTAVGGDACNGGEGGLWTPDLRTREVVWGAGIMVKF